MRSNNKRGTFAVAMFAVWMPLAGVAQDRPAAVDGPSVLGAPYDVAGITYTPADPAYYDDVGYAALAQDGSRNGATLTGEAFSPDAITAAHKTLPLPSYVEVTALDSGRTILVRVNDRGPMTNDRIIALSPGAAAQLGLAPGGAVRVRRVNPPEPERAILRAGGKAAERLPTPIALLKALRAKLPAASAPLGAPAAKSEPAAQARPGADFDSAPSLSHRNTPVKTAAKTAEVKPAPPPEPAAQQGRYVVQLGAFSTQARAKALADRADGYVEPVGALWRVRMGPFPTKRAAQAALRSASAKGVENGAIIPHDGR